MGYFWEQVKLSIKRRFHRKPMIIREGKEIFDVDEKILIKELENASKRINNFFVLENSRGNYIQFLVKEKGRSFYVERPLRSDIDSWQIVSFQSGKIMTYYRKNINKKELIALFLKFFRKELETNYNDSEDWIACRKPSAELGYTRDGKTIIDFYVQKRDSIGDMVKIKTITVDEILNTEGFQGLVNKHSPDTSYIL